MFIFKCNKTCFLKIYCYYSIGKVENQCYLEIPDPRVCRWRDSPQACYCFFVCAELIPFSSLSVWWGWGFGWLGESNRPLTEGGGGLEAFVLGLWFWLHPTGLKLDSYWACSHRIFFHQGQSQQECSRNCYFGSVCVLLIMTTKIKVHFFPPWNILQGEFSFPSFFFFF